MAVVPTEPRRLAHKMADEVVLQFTGEAGVADTKIAYVAPRDGTKEIGVMDYDGVGRGAADREPVHQSVAALESGRPLAGLHVLHAGLSVLYRLFAFERRPVQLLAASSASIPRRPGARTASRWR
jgi:Tol biopolymer transport system component